uniref:Formamidopyrimidine-DNA glycosylase n=1 Tax=Angiostrongylus cantonensis TaxID=6313 RepID=A0A0K0DQB2_ANGCA
LRKKKTPHLNAQGEKERSKLTVFTEFNYYLDLDGDMPGVLRFGKRRGFEKKEVPGVLRFGKRTNKKSVPGVLRFGKRSVPGVLRFGKREMPGMLR